VKVGDLVRHIHTGKIYLVTSNMRAGLVTLLGFPPNQVFNTWIDLELISELESISESR
jgi:hypothetical protein